MHRWVEGSLAQWLEPSFHKQLLISTSRVQIKKKERKRRRRKENVEMGIRMQIHKKVEEKRLKPAIQKQVLISRSIKREMEKERKGKKEGDQSPERDN